MSTKRAPSKAEILKELTALARRMHRIGVVMKKYGGVSPMRQHGLEMIGSAAIARVRIAYLRKLQ